MQQAQGYQYTAVPTSDPVDQPQRRENGSIHLAFRKLSKEVGAIGSPGSRSARAASKDGATLVERWKRGDFIIIPESNPFMDIWDVFVIIALALTAFLLPFEVALVVAVPPKMAFLDHCIDLIFTIDIVLTFNVAIQQSSTTQEWEKTPTKIARHYMAVPFSDNLTAGWFWPDVCTVIPWDAVTSPKAGEQLKLVRVLRLVRMLRLVRVLKLFKRLHTKVGFSFALVKITKCMLVSLLLVHWLACGWAHLGLYGREYSDAETNWMASTQLAKHKELADFSVVDAYTEALYVCFVVLTTVGFGDVVPLNTIEVLSMTGTIFLTGLTWAWVVANVVDVINHMDVFGLHFKQVMDDLNQLMREKNVKGSMQVRVRKHLHEAYHVHRHRHNQTVVRWLSDGLQGELAAAAGVDTICSKIWYFRDMSNVGYIIDLAQHFVAELYSPDELIMSSTEAVSVIIKGSVVRNGRFLIRHDVIGEDMILVTEVLKDSSIARTVSLCEVMTLHRNRLLEVCEKHEDLNLRIRRAQVKLAIWRAFVWVAKRLNSRSKRQRGTTWDTWLGSEGQPHEPERGSPKDSDRLSANDMILQTLNVQKREGWVESGGGHGAMAQLFARKVGGRDAGKSGEILNQLTALRNQVGRHQQEMSRRLDDLSEHVQSVDRRTQELEDRRRQEQLEAEQAAASAASGYKDKSATSSRLFGRKR